MKKEYVKPYLAVESFQMTAALAAGCTNIPNEDGEVLFGQFTFFEAGKCQYDFYNEEDNYSYLGPLWYELKSTYSTS